MIKIIGGYFLGIFYLEETHNSMEGVLISSVAWEYCGIPQVWVALLDAFDPTTEKC